MYPPMQTGQCAIVVVAVVFVVPRQGQSQEPVDARRLQETIHRLRCGSLYDRQRAAMDLTRVGAAASEAVPVLIEGLDDADVNLRDACARALGAIGAAAEPAVPRLLKAVQNPGDRRFRVLALEVLAYIGPGAKTAVPVLLETVEDYSDADVPRLAGKALSQIDTTAARRAVTPLLRELQSPKRAVRAMACDGLGALGAVAEDAVPRLAILLSSDTEDQVRLAAARALGGIGPKAAPAVPALIAALSSNQLDVAPVAEALGTIGPAAKEAAPALVAYFRQRDRYGNREASRALGKMGPAVIPNLLRALADDDDETRFRSAQALGYIGAPAVPALCAALTADQRNVRESAARALVYARCRATGQPPLAAAEAVIGSLNDPDPTVLRWKIRALEQLGEGAQAGTVSLIRCLDHEDWLVRYEAMIALARIGPPAAAELIVALQNASPRIRAGAARALGFVRAAPGRAIEPMISLLTDADAAVRFSAADGLASIGTDAVPRLVELAVHHNEAVRIGAIYALGMCHEKPNDAHNHRHNGLPKDLLQMCVITMSQAIQDREVSVRRVAADSLLNLGRPARDFDLVAVAVAVPALQVALKDDDASVRYWSAKALAVIRRPDSAAFQAQADALAASSRIAHYYGMEHDLEMLRLTWEPEGPTVKASSIQALAAAHRVFDKSPLLGMTKEQVVALVGDPKTVSYRGVAADMGPDTPLVYRFDGAPIGVQYTLRFKQGRLTKIEGVNFS